MCHPPPRSGDDAALRLRCRTLTLLSGMAVHKGLSTLMFPRHDVDIDVVVVGISHSVSTGPIFCVFQSSMVAVAETRVRVMRTS